MNAAPLVQVTSGDRCYVSGARLQIYQTSLSWIRFRVAELRMIAMCVIFMALSKVRGHFNVPVV